MASEYEGYRSFNRGECPHPPLMRCAPRASNRIKSIVDEERRREGLAEVRLPADWGQFGVLRFTSKITLRRQVG
jgi:hypothetical protein